MRNEDEEEEEDTAGGAATRNAGGIAAGNVDAEEGKIDQRNRLYIILLLYSFVRG